MRQRRVVSLVGTGHVGVAAAYALFIKGLASELILIDKDARRAEGEAMDLMHGQSLVGSMTVRAGTYADLQEAQIVIISAGVRSAPAKAVWPCSTATPRSSVKSSVNWTAMRRMPF